MSDPLFHPGTTCEQADGGPQATNLPRALSLPPQRAGASIPQAWCDSKVQGSELVREACVHHVLELQFGFDVASAQLSQFLAGCSHGYAGPAAHTVPAHAPCKNPSQ